MSYNDMIFLTSFPGPNNIKRDNTVVIKTRGKNIKLVYMGFLKGFPNEKATTVAMY
jgi:hypothetical protein